MTKTAEYCIAAIGLNAYQDKQIILLLYLNFIILPPPACFYASQGGSCCVKPIGALQLTVAGCSSPSLNVSCTYRMIGSGCPEVI